MRYRKFGNIDWEVSVLDFGAMRLPIIEKDPAHIDEPKAIEMVRYPSQRFNDKAAVYYSAELRVIPRWNPFEHWDWIQKYVGIRWLQFVPFAEIGRVAPSWNIETLHSHMKWCLGFGVRAWAKGIVARIDSAVSEEDFKIQMMIA